MKIKLKYILSGLFIIFLTSSCEKWLDVTSPSEIKAEEKFKTEDGFKDALIGVYVGMTSPYLYSKSMTWNMIDLLSQQYEPLDGLALYDEFQRYEYETSKSSSIIKSMWINMYNNISNINSELSFIDVNQDVLHPISHSVIKGELLGLRAFLHFDLMRVFGHSNVANRDDIAGKYAIPYVMEFTKDLTQQLSYDQTFDLMLADIDAALELLKEDPIYKGATHDANYYDIVNKDGFYSNRENRMNYYAVLALKARILMWIGGTENITAAGIAAEEVILNSAAHLIDSQSYPISSDPILYQEHLFNLNVNAFADIVNPFLIATDASKYNALFISNQNAENLYEKENVNIGEVDIRFNTLLENQGLGKVCIKMRQYEGSYSPLRNNDHKNILPLMKIPEMYYIVAESCISGNIQDLTKAIGYLNTVRASRGIIQEIPADTDLQNVSEELFKEYRKEFISEGQLFFYYKRNGVTNIPGLSAETIVDDVIYMLPYPDSELAFGRIQ